MHHRRYRVSISRRALCLALAFALTGCATWQPTEMTPRQAFTEKRPAMVRVTTTDGTQTTLDRSRLLGDVIAGFDQACLEQFGRATRTCPEMGIPVFEVSVLELKERSTVMLLLPAVLGLTALWVVANR